MNEGPQKAKSEREKCLPERPLSESLMDRFGPIVLKNSFAAACEVSSKQFDLSERPTIDDRRSVKGSTTLERRSKIRKEEFFNRIGQKRSFDLSQCRQ
jgi:hypothetical protein